jgi:hypothetical protein
VLQPPYTSPTTWYVTGDSDLGGSKMKTVTFLFWLRIYPSWAGIVNEQMWTLKKSTLARVTDHSILHSLVKQRFQENEKRKQTQSSSISKATWITAHSIASGKVSLTSLYGVESSRMPSTAFWRLFSNGSRIWIAGEVWCSQQTFKACRVRTSVYGDSRAVSVLHAGSERRTRVY